MPDDATAANVRPEELLAHAAWLRRLAAALVGGSNDPDDLVQEAWLAALRRPPRGEHPGRTPGPPLRPWLAEVLRNAARMRARAATRRLARDGASAAAEPDEAPSPEALLDRLRAQRELAQLVAGLAEPYRSTLLLHYYEGLTSAEIARAQRVPAGTVRWRLKTGLDQLRAALDRQSGGERRAWRAALLPLAAPAAAPWAGPLKAWLKGVWFMSRAFKTVAVTSLVAAAGAGALITAARPRPAALAGPDATAARAATAPDAGARAPGPVAEARRARDAMRDDIVASLRRREAAARAAAGAAPPRAASRPTDAPPEAAPADDGSPPRGRYEPAYIQEVFREAMFPLLQQCYENALAAKPKLAGKLVLSFSIVADPDVGGVVDEASFGPGTDLDDPEMEACARESLLTLTFDKPPAGGGYVTVDYPVAFSSDDENREADEKGGPGPKGPPR